VEQKPHSVALEQHIAAQRQQLGANIEELGNQLGGAVHGAGEKIGTTADRAREAADWRTWVRKHPLMLVALAFGGGFWLAFRK
jgi:hypothetical protein